MKTKQKLSNYASGFLKKRLTYALSAVLLALTFFSGECPEPTPETPLTVTKLTINDNSVDLTNPQTQTNIPLSPTIVATLSHTITSAELEGKLTLGPETSGDNIGISITAGNDKSFTVALAAGASLSQNTTYILTFKKGLSATIDGVTYSLAQDISVKFTTQNTHTITFDAKGGSEVAAITVGDGETLTLPTAPTRENYGFDGWYKDENLTQALATTETISSDLTLYAKWTLNSFTVTFDSKSGSAVEAKTVNHGEKLALPTAPTREGHDFAGWYKNNDLTMAFDEMTETITSDVTLYAKWRLVISHEFVFTSYHFAVMGMTFPVNVNDVGFVVSESETPPTKSSVSGNDSYITRDFVASDTLNVYLSMLENFGLTNYEPAGGSLVTIAADNSNNPGLLQANTKYYAHAYYQYEGADHVFTTSFTTAAAETDSLEGNSTNKGVPDLVRAFETFTSDSTAIPVKVGEPLPVSFVLLRHQKEGGPTHQQTQANDDNEETVSIMNVFVGVLSVHSNNGYSFPSLLNFYDVIYVRSPLQSSKAGNTIRFQTTVFLNNFYRTYFSFTVIPD